MVVLRVGGGSGGIINCLKGLQSGLWTKMSVTKVYVKKVFVR